MRSDNPYLIPGAIVVAGLIIAGAVYFSDRGSAPPPQSGGGGNTQTTAYEKVKPITSADHIRGNPNAPVKIIEFSDLECPFCKDFHVMMMRVMDDYGKRGQVAWVYRHFPLDRHPKATPEAEASECAAELGGNDKFWAYVDKIFAITPSNNGLDLALLPKVAADIGLNRAAFQTCLDSRRHAARVQADYQDAVNSGGTGTPYSIIIARDGRKIPLSGLPRQYEYLKSIIDEAL